MGASRTVKTTCPYCGVGCGIDATIMDDGSVKVAGDKSHPANFGRLCSKGANLAETLGNDGRLLSPEIAGHKTTWDQALDMVAMGFRNAIERHGPDSVAFYVSGQLLTEDYYVANKLMKGFIGSANIDTNSRLCMASSVAGHKRAFGSDTVPGLYEDLELADMVVLVGSNLAWCHPVLYQRIEAARKKRRIKTVVIDPRRTATAEMADLHLPLKPGSDVALFNGLLTWMAQNGGLDGGFIVDHTSDFTAAMRAAAGMGLPEVAARCGLEIGDIARFYDMFIRTERTVTVYSQGVNQSSAGTDKVNAIINCHLATGRIGRPGMGPLSATGQPNAMGGRETGGLANQLACHMELGNPAHRDIVQRFWQSPNIADAQGLKAVDLFDAVADGRIKALWIMATNPAVSLPDVNHVRRAMAACPLVVVSDVVERTDTLEFAHIRLPALAWGEKDGTVTNSERRISRQRTFIDAPGEAKPDWWIVTEVAKRMGHADAFQYDSAADIFREYAQLTAFENNGARDLDLGGLGEVTDNGYDALPPTLWPQRKDAPSGDGRFFADGGFFTQNGRANFVAVDDRLPVSAPSDAFPLVLNTGRIRDQWHTMTRTGRSATLSRHMSEPFIEVSPLDAKRLSLSPASIARVTSQCGECLVRVLVTDRVSAGDTFMPMHWNAQWSGHAATDSLVARHVDPVSGQPESKFTPVRVTPFAASRYGFAVSINAPSLGASEYWALARCDNGWRLEMADAQPLENAADWLSDVLGVLPTDPSLRVMSFADSYGECVRLAAFRGHVLIAAGYISRNPVAVDRSWVTAQLGSVIPSTNAEAILAGRPGAGEEDSGSIVCSCMSLGANTIRNAIRKHGCINVDQVGTCTGAGTNCGSCRPEIEGLLSDAKLRHAS